MVKDEAIYAVENTIKQFHIHKNIHMIYKQDLYKIKQKEIDDLFLEYLLPVIEDIKHPALVKKWIQIFDAAAYEKLFTKMKIYHKLRRKLIVIIKHNSGQK